MSVGAIGHSQEGVEWEIHVQISDGVYKGYVIKQVSYYLHANSLSNDVCQDAFRFQATGGKPDWATSLHCNSYLEQSWKLTEGLA